MFLSIAILLVELVTDGDGVCRNDHTAIIYSQDGVLIEYTLINVADLPINSQFFTN